MDPYAEQFWSFTTKNELRLQQCGDCGGMRWPPAAVCDGCLSASYKWVEVTGAAKLVSWVTFRRQYFPQYPPPHTAIVVELGEGPLFVSALDDERVAELHEGMEMELGWKPSQDRHGEYNLPVFRPRP